MPPQASHGRALADRRKQSGHVGALAALTARERLLVDAVAERVLELLHVEPARALLSARALADRLGVDRSYVYEHADVLGAIRLGDGPRARLRFDLETARAAGVFSTDREPAPILASAGAKSTPRAASHRRRSPNVRPQVGSVLSVRGARGEQDVGGRGR
jgi:hypothetical protein